MSLIKTNVIDSSIRFAAESATRAWHPELRDEEFYRQQERYIAFTDKICPHLKEIANQYAQIAEDSLNIAVPKPFSQSTVMFGRDEQMGEMASEAAK